MALSGNLMLSARRLGSDRAKARAEIIAAVKAAKGNLSEAARRLGITKRTLSRWLASDRSLAAACKAERGKRPK
jgi:ActR/RegA family two-component response regulator